MSTVAVYVHGLWLTGFEGGLLRRRLARDLNAETRAFSYPSVLSSMADNARALAEFLHGIRADTLHLVGHSLGGLVILKLFEQGYGADLAPGRIVLLGSPLAGSRTAHNVARLPFGRRILGRGVEEELLNARERRWNGQRELGVIAGNLSIGLGRLVGAAGAREFPSIWFFASVIRDCRCRRRLRARARRFCVQGISHLDFSRRDPNSSSGTKDPTPPVGLKCQDPPREVR
jgi:pimeloyl-ACP methyl ester carboxylesterase